MKNTRKQIGYLYLILTFVLWGSLYVVSKYVLGKLPTFTISFLRFMFAFVVLTLIMHNRKVKKIERQDYKYIFFIGFAGYFIAVGAQLLGTKYADASLASLLNSLNPITMTLMAAIILHEKLTVRKVIGMALALVGVYIILGNNIHGASFIGILFSLFSVVLWSVVSVLTRKLTTKYDPLQITRYGIAIAAIGNFPIGVIELINMPSVQMDFSCIVSLAYMGIFCTGIAYMLWNKSLFMIEASTCSAFYSIQPLISTLLGVVFLGESVSVFFLAGSVLIVAGVLINLSSRSKLAVQS